MSVWSVRALICVLLALTLQGCQKHSIKLTHTCTEWNDQGRCATWSTQGTVEMGAGGRRLVSFSKGAEPRRLKGGGGGDDNNEEEQIILALMSSGAFDPPELLH